MKNGILQKRIKDILKMHMDGVAIEYGNQKITYSELDLNSNVIANWIINKEIRRESLIGLSIEDSIANISALLGTLKAGCTVIPLSRDFPILRLKKMIKSINLGWVIGDTLSINKLKEIDPGIKFIAVEDLLKKNRTVYLKETPVVEYAPDDKIYVYFTSGTTDNPKAIIGKSKGLLHYIDWEMDTFKIKKNLRISQFSPICFDAFLKELFVSLLSGGTLCIPVNIKSILNSHDLIDWVDVNRIELLHCIPSVFRLFNSNKLSRETCLSLKYILLSGEEIFPFDLKKWYKIYNERVQIVNLYGQTETTILKTYYLINKSDTNREKIPIGKPIKGARAIILDKNLNICKINDVGEIYIRTPFSTFGYCNEPEANDQSFIKNPFNSDPKDFIYKTGDLGKFLPDGNIEFLGRIDRQVKLRGVRIEPEEIERIVIKHPSIEEAVAIKVENSVGNESLCLFVSQSRMCSRMEESLFLSSLKKFISERLMDFMIPSHIIILDHIPRNQIGKINYKNLLDRFKEENTEYIPPENDVERELAKIWSEILGKKRIGKTNDFFNLGGNSLSVLSLISLIHKEFDVRISIAEIFNNLNIEKQAKMIKEAKRDKFLTIEPVEEKEYYNLSSAQKRLFILQQIDINSVNYNSPQLFLVEGELDKVKFSKIFNQLIKRHESLRTRIQMVETIPVQIILKEFSFDIEYHDLRTDKKRYRMKSKNLMKDDYLNGESVQLIVKNFLRPFDLNQVPLFRVGLIRIEKHKYIIMFDMHHIITDNISYGIFTKEFLQLYTHKKLPSIKLQYKDFSEWQIALNKSILLKSQENYWLKRLEGDIPKLDLPTDFTRPQFRESEGKTIGFQINKDLLRKIKEISIDTGSTLHMVLLAIYNILLSFFTGQEDIMVGSPNTGRTRVELQHIIGMFANILVIRNQPEGGKTFKKFLEEVKDNLLNAYDNQDFQYDELVSKLGLQGEKSSNPLLDTVFLFNTENSTGNDETIDDLDLKFIPMTFGVNTAKFDLTLEAIETDDKVNLRFKYSTSLFKDSTIEKLKQYFMEILTQAVENNETKINDITIRIEKCAANSTIFIEDSLDFQL